MVLGCKFFTVFNSFSLWVFSNKHDSRRKESTIFIQFYHCHFLANIQLFIYGLASEMTVFYFYFYVLREISVCSHVDLILLGDVMPDLITAASHK